MVIMVELSAQQVQFICKALFCFQIKRVRRREHTEHNALCASLALILFHGARDASA